MNLNLPSASAFFSGQNVPIAKKIIERNLPVVFVYLADRWLMSEFGVGTVCLLQ